jgi:hypothetical protein
VKDRCRGQSEYVLELKGSCYRAFLAARDNDFFEAARRPSRRSAFEDARERIFEVFFFLALWPRLLSAAAFFLVSSDVLPFAGGGSLTPLSPRLGQSDRYGLLGRARAVLATSNVLNFFPDKLPGLHRRSFSFPFSLARSSQSLFLWHHAPPDPGLSSFLKPYLRPAVQGCTVAWLIAAAIAHVGASSSSIPAAPRSEAQKDKLEDERARTKTTGETNDCWSSNPALLDAFLAQRIL